MLKDYLGDFDQLSRIITDDIMEQFVIVGTPKECVAKIRKKGEMGITHIQVLRPTVETIKAMADVVNRV